MIGAVMVMVAAEAVEAPKMAGAWLGAVRVVEASEAAGALVVASGMMAVPVLIGTGSEGPLQWGRGGSRWRGLAVWRRAAVRGV